MDLGNLDVGALMKKAMDLQSQAGQLQADLAKLVVEASAGGGMVTARANGTLEIVGITIDPSAVDPEDIEMLQDLIVAACTAAQRKAREAAAAEMSKLTGGVSLPDIGKLIGGLGKK